MIPSLQATNTMAFIKQPASSHDEDSNDMNDYTMILQGPVLVESKDKMATSSPFKTDSTQSTRVNSSDHGQDYEKPGWQEICFVEKFPG